jgi:lipopolysaccharide/colanic/teichoic acid biosynthesis glycosyltransferase
MKELIINECGEDVYNYFNLFVTTEDSKTFIVSTTNEFNILNSNQNFDNLINLSKLNNIRYLNKFFEKINTKLTTGSVFICCFETIAARRERQKTNKIILLGPLLFFFEFVFLRIFPKVWGFKKVYFFITRGRNRLLSKAEVMGRLVSCGFKINAEESFNGIKYIVAIKERLPEYNMNASYGPVFKMRRLGKEGKEIGVYKFRTMHPYAEYLQDYVLKLNGYGQNGKPKDDFRVTPWGKFLRRYWLDELPQLINVFKGELNFVGVRPISLRYFQDIPEDLKNLRLKFKPGCIPPYVALNRNNDLESVLQAEREYLFEKLKNPIYTDIKFFIKAICNILFKRKRSA